MRTEKNSTKLYIYSLKIIRDSPKNVGLNVTFCEVINIKNICPFSASPSVHHLTGIAEGVTDLTRDGEEVRLHSINIRLQIRSICPFSASPIAAVAPSNVQSNGFLNLL